MFGSGRRWVRAVSQQLINDCSGASAVLTAVALTAITGFVGLGLDVGYWLTEQRNLQGVADQAAYSAAVAASADTSAGTSNGQAVAAQLGFVNGDKGVSLAVNTPPTQGAYASPSYTNVAWEVVISEVQPNFFSQLFMSAPTETVRAVAVSGTTSLCVLGLNSNSKDTLQINGSSTINLNCAMASNSSATQGFDIGGSANVTASAAYIVANTYSAGNATSINIQNIKTSQSAITDPYASRSIPSYGGCDKTSYAPSANVTLSANAAGMYVLCNGLTINSGVTVTLNAGTYIVDGGVLKVAGGGGLIGNGVTLVLTGGTNGQPCCATASVAGGAIVRLVAPTSGPLKGLAVFQDRNAPAGSGSTMTGGDTQYISGALYFSNTTLTYTGNSSSTTTGKCTQLIADKVQFTGNSKVALQCNGVGVTGIGGSITKMAE
jgi:Flp pilus assembly protein TadG